MKPLKGLTAFALWLLRISLVLFAISNFWNYITSFSFQNIYSIFAFLFILSSILLFLGGFWKKNTTTVLSALVMVAFSIYHLFDIYEGISLQMFTQYSIWTTILGISLLFAAVGNKA